MVELHFLLKTIELLTMVLKLYLKSSGLSYFMQMSFDDSVLVDEQFAKVL